jgi:hypothetical protein
MNKDNNSDNPFFLCKNNDNNCKKLIEMIEAIMLNKLLQDRSYINENNEIAESVINNTTNKLTRQLIVNPDTKTGYEEKRKEKMQATSNLIEEFNTNLYNSGVGQNMGQQGMDEGMGFGMLSNAMDVGMNHMNMEHLPHNIPHNIPRGGGNRRKSNKKTHKNRKTYKKSKRIRKI